MGRDRESQFADPMFEDLAKRDFRLKPGSPAEKIGFKPWDLTLAGVRKDRCAKWHALAAKGHDYPTWETAAKPWPAPPYKVDQTFERVALGIIGIRNAKYEHENKGESIGVTDEASSPIPLVSGKTTANNSQPSQTTANLPSKRSLKVQDAPGLKHSYDPVLDIYPKWAESGTYHVSFDIMAQPGADWFFEMRNQAGEFAAGPYLRWQKGTLVANNTSSQKLADVKPGEWLRIDLTTTTGASRYDITLTRQDGTKTEFKSIPCKPTWDTATYLLFSALGTTKTAFFIDNLKLEQTTP
jgi:hypothetical protein